MGGIVGPNMSLGKGFSLAMIGAVLLVLLGTALNIAGSEAFSLVAGVLVGGMALLTVAVLLAGYQIGRRVPPDQRRPHVPFLVRLLVAEAVVVAGAIVLRVSRDGISAAMAVADWLFTLERGGFFTLNAGLAVGCLGYGIGRRMRDGRSPALPIATLALGGLLAVAFWAPLVASVAALQGQEVDTRAPDFVPPNLATTVALSEGTQLTAGAPARMVVTVENRGSGSVLATVTLLIPSAFSEPVVRAPESFGCKVRTSAADHVVTCEGGTVGRGAPVTITAETRAPTASGTYVVGAMADLRLGFTDPDRSDNIGGAAVTVR